MLVTRSERDYRDIDAVSSVLRCLRCLVYVFNTRVLNGWNKFSGEVLLTVKLADPLTDACDLSPVIPGSKGVRG